MCAAMSAILLHYTVIVVFGTIATRVRYAFVFANRSQSFS
jgi:hypothetical protein